MHAMTRQQTRFRLEFVVRGLLWGARGLALAALLGHAAHKARLITLLPEWQGMSMLTAFGVLAAAMPLRRTRLRKPQLALCWIAIALMLAVLWSHLVWHADILSPAFAYVLLGVYPSLSGRVSVATATGVLALCVVALAARAPARYCPAIVEVGCNLALLIAGAALLGYAYRVSDLYGLYIFNTMSLQSALAIFCLALARLVASRRTRLGMALRSTSLGVRQLRRMLALTAIPAALGCLLTRAGGALANGNSAHLALLALAGSVPLFYLLLENARAFEMLERERRRQHGVEERITLALRARVDEQTAKIAAVHRQQVEALAQTERNKRLEMIAQLTGSIAHDFNNLLMVVGGSAQLLKLRMRADTATLPLVDKIADTVKSAAKLTAQLSSFSRTQRLENSPLRIDEVVRAAIDETEARRPSGIHLTVDFGAGDATVLSDKGQLQLALVHLITNAWEAMESGGTLFIATASQTMAEDIRIASVRIGDTGAGMEEAVLRQAVEPFFTTKQGRHAGLGLAQVSSVVQQAGGSMEITSRPGAGTNVDLSLPCLSVLHAGAAPGPRSAALLPAASQRLLVIDDDDDVRSVTVALLRHLDYEVIEARDGEGGLRLLRQHAPALALIDYLMPGMNGAEVARRARLHAPGLPIIFISGYADTQAIEAVERSRMLRKPLAADDLALAISDALRMA